MRPGNTNEEGETIVHKTSVDSLTMLGQQFTFDSVADSFSSQASGFFLFFKFWFSRINSDIEFG